VKRGAVRALRPVPDEIHPVVYSLKGRRIALGLSQREVAARSDGLRQAEISYWERGHGIPTLPNLDRWAAALECEIIAVEKEPE
jgi:transcriptional regulator with XRE-family HTH domain